MDLFHLALSDLSGRSDAPGPKLSQFHAVFENINLAKSYVGALPGGLAPSPTGNPGSAPVWYYNLHSKKQKSVAGYLYFRLSSSCLNFFVIFQNIKLLNQKFQVLLFLITGSGGGARGTHPLSVQFFFHFHAVFSEKLAKNNRFLLPPLGLSLCS